MYEFITSDDTHRPNTSMLIHMCQPTSVVYRRCRVTNAAHKTDWEKQQQIEINKYICI